MPLIDQNGKELRLRRAPHYDVKIVASRREIVWNDGDEREENREDVYKPEVTESNVIVQTDPGEKPNIKERRSDQKESYKKREKDGKELNYHKKTSINKRNQPGKPPGVLLLQEKVRHWTTSNKGLMISRNDA